MGKNKQRKSGKDKITGLSLEFTDIGARIASDKVYDINSPIGKFLGNQLGREPIQGSIEFELNSDFIAITMQFRYDVPDGPGNLDSLTRTVLQGSFSYNKGQLAEAMITGVAQNWPDGVGLGGVLYTSSQGGEKVEKTSSWYSLERASNSVSSLENRVASYLDFARDGSNDDEVVGLGEQAKRDFGGGRFFYENWWDNPFASNLI